LKTTLELSKIKFGAKMFLKVDEKIKKRSMKTHKNIKFKSKPFGPLFDLCTKIQNHEDRDKAPGFDAGVVRSEL